MSVVQETLICIYCKKTVPEVKPTVSHIIPDFMAAVSRKYVDKVV